MASKKAKTFDKNRWGLGRRDVGILSVVLFVISYITVSVAINNGSLVLYGLTFLLFGWACYYVWAAITWPRAIK